MFLKKLSIKFRYIILFWGILLSSLHKHQLGREQKILLRDWLQRLAATKLQKLHQQKHL